MRKVLRRWLFRGAVAWMVLVAAKAPAQTPTLPAPRPLSESAPADAPAPQQPPAYVLPPTDAWTTAALPFPDPLLDRPGAPCLARLSTSSPITLAFISAINCRSPFR